MSWKPEQKVGGVWYPNAVAFATKEEAEANARAKFNAWTMSEGHRAVESTEAPNYTYNLVTGELRSIERNFSQHCAVTNDHANCPGETTLGTDRCHCPCHNA